MKKKMVIVTTIPLSFIFFKGQLSYLNQYFDIFIISSQKEKLRKVANEEGVQYKYINLYREIKILSDILSLFQLIFYFLKLRPHIVHGNTPKASLLSMIAAYFGLVPNRIYMCHGLRYQGETGLKKNILKKMEKITCFFSTKIICVSKGLIDTFQEENLSPRKPVLINHGSSNGINLEYYNKNEIKINLDHLKKENNIDPTDFVFCFIGRVVRDKGINELIQAFISLKITQKNIKLMLVGSYDDKDHQISEEVHKIIQNESNIIIVGHQNDIRPYLSVSDTLILPSFREGLGMVLIEAAAMNVPCIASDIIGCNNIIVNGVNGLLCKPRDITSLKEKMDLIIKDTKLRDKIKNQTRRSIQERFDQKKVWAEYLKLYTSLN